MTKEDNGENVSLPNIGPLLNNYHTLLNFVKQLAAEWNGKEPPCWTEVVEDLGLETPDDAFGLGQDHETQVRAYDAVAMLESIGIKEHKN